MKVRYIFKKSLSILIQKGSSVSEKYSFNKAGKYISNRVFNYA